MSLFDWFRRPKAIQPDSVARRSKTVVPRQLPFSGYVLSSDPQRTVHLNEDIKDSGELMLIGPKRSLAYGGIVFFATVLLMGRSLGWRGGREFFDDSPRGAFLRPLRSGMALSDADALSLSRSLSASLPAGAADKGADVAAEIIASLSEGGFTIQLSPQDYVRPKATQPHSVPRGSKTRPDGFVMSPDPAPKIFLNIDMTTPGELMLVGSKRSLAYSPMLFTTVLLLGRSCGWRGGREFFDDSPPYAFVRPLRLGMALSHTDVLSLSRSLSASLPAGGASEGADVAAEFIAFSSEGGFTIHSATDYWSRSKRTG